MMEKQLYNSPDELFTKSDLTNEEKEIFLKNLKYCEYWLLRIKGLCYQTWNKGHPSYLKLIARVLINLESKNVSGSKENFLKEMFSDKKIHRIYENKFGFRSTQNSPKVDTAYFELKIMSFFLKNKYKCSLPNEDIEGVKIPEFKAIINNFSVNVEAKRLDDDATLDCIFGDSFILGIDYKMSEKEKDKGHIKISQQFSRNYENAITKYKHISKNEYFLIFIYINDLAFNSKYLVEYINDLQNQWSTKNYSRLVGLIITNNKKTIPILNSNCSEEATNQIIKTNIANFHNYIPEVINA